MGNLRVSARQAMWAWALAAVVAVCLAPATAWATVSVSDPRVVADGSMESGQVTTWDCVWFGSYPQAYVDDVATVAALDEATGWSASGDLTYGGVTYRRLRESDATYSSTYAGFWSWSSKVSSSGYCYFRWDPVKWRVLETNGTTSLVVADTALDSLGYHGHFEYGAYEENVTWEICALREWLNGTFWGACLDASQQGAVVEQTLVNADNTTYYGSSGGPDTVDRVFLLAESDMWNGADAARHGFADAYNTSDEARRCRASGYAHAMGAYSDFSLMYLGDCYWWLRSPANSACSPMFVSYFGNIHRGGYYTNVGGGAVRPALTISLSSDQISYAGTVSSDGTVSEVAPTGTGGEDDEWQEHDVTLNTERSTTTARWSDEWLARSSSQYNHGLCTTGSILASAAYDEGSARASLDALGFDSLTYSSYYPTESDYLGDYDRVGYLFGSKKSSYDGKTIVAVLVRGTKGAEWVTNFNLADNTYPNPTHESFETSERRLRTSLCDWLSEQGIDASEAKFLVVGHSRGAAVANLLGYYLDIGGVANLELGGETAKGNAYVYTYATPNVTSRSDVTSGEYDNIFNVVGAEDTIPKVPLSEWGYGKYGTTKTLPSRSNMNPIRYRQVLAAMRPHFEAIYGEEFQPYKDGVITSRRFVRAFYGVARSPADYYAEDSSGRTIAWAMHSLGKRLGGVDEDALWAALKYFILKHPLFSVTLIFVVVESPGTAATLIMGNSIYPLPLATAFTHAHTSESYVAWLQAGGADMFAGSYEDVFAGSYRSLVIACPVDVRVYDESDGSMVCSITDSVVDEGVMAEGLAAAVVDDVKHIDLPADGSYRIEVVATGDGTMDVAYEELSAEGRATGMVAYADLPLAVGDSYELRVSEADEGAGVSGAVEVGDPSGETVEPSYLAEGDLVSSVDIQVGVSSGDGTAGGTTVASYGEPVVVTATPSEGAAFLGWYEGGTLVSEDARYQFCALADRTLEASFTNVPTPIEGADVTVAATRLRPIPAPRSSPRSP